MRRSTRTPGMMRDMASGPGLSVVIEGTGFDRVVSGVESSVAEEQAASECASECDHSGRSWRGFMRSRSSRRRRRCWSGRAGRRCCGRWCRRGAGVRRRATDAPDGIPAAQECFIAAAQRLLHEGIEHLQHRLTILLFDGETLRGADALGAALLALRVGRLELRDAVLEIIEE